MPGEEGGTTHEEAAVAEVHAVGRRVRAAMFVLFFFGGVAVGTGAFFALRAFQIARMGGWTPVLCAIIAYTPTIGGALFLAPRAARGIVARIMPGLVEALAEKYKLDRTNLAEMARLAER
jgi:hypothetical protein